MFSVFSIRISALWVYYNTFFNITIYDNNDNKLSSAVSCVCVEVRKLNNVSHWAFPCRRHRPLRCAKGMNFDRERQCGVLFWNNEWNMQNTVNWDSGICRVRQKSLWQHMSMNDFPTQFVCAQLYSTPMQSMQFMHNCIDIIAHGMNTQSLCK